MARGPLPQAAGVPPDATGNRNRLDIVLGILAIFAIAMHDAAHIRDGYWYNAFWICNIAALLVGPAVLARSPVLSGVAFTWLLPGTAVWLVDALVVGSRILPTSYAVHLGGTAVAIYAVRRSGWRHGVRWPVVFGASIGILVVAVLISRWALPVAANVNAAHAVPRGWSFLGADRPVFLVSAAALAASVAMGGARLAQAIGSTALSTCRSTTDTLGA